MFINDPANREAEFGERSWAWYPLDMVGSKHRPLRGRGLRSFTKKHRVSSDRHGGVLENGPTGKIRRWYDDEGRLHREDGPAVLYENGTQIWWHHGKVHRADDLPAVLRVEGTQEWYYQGERHRDNDQPAMVTAGGRKMWYQHGQLHRDDDPAIIYEDGTEAWYTHGGLHRIGAPAVIYSSHSGRLYYEHETTDRLWVADTAGEEWWVDGRCHRAGDDPAKSWENGMQEWWIDGQHHRVDGPAVIYPNGKQEWYYHGVQNASQEDLTKFHQELVKIHQVQKDFENNTRTDGLSDALLKPRE